MAKIVVTKIKYKGDGQTKTYVIPFEYLSKSHVIITVNEKPQTYEYVSAYTITFDTAPQSNTDIVIERQTDMSEPYIVWYDGTVLVSDEINAQQLQHLFIAQENYNIVKELAEETERLLAAITENNKLLIKYSKAMPIPFGRFYVDSDGQLKITLYGTVPDDTLRITSDGTLQLEITLKDGE